jgi:alcohol dehydrogenase
MWGLSYRIRARARRANVRYAFLFVQPSGAQLQKLNALCESGAIRPVLDKVFPFEQTPEAMSYVESGRAKGKVVVKVG